jgi:hypothetical protein
VTGGYAGRAALARRLLKGLAMPTTAARAALPAILLAAVATTTTITTAHAEGPIGTTPSPAAAPQNADWNDVSHLNGQLVKVGETNDYKKSFKRTIISTNPLGWIYGAYGASVSHALNSHIAVRGDVNYLSSFLDEGTTGLEVGVGLPIYFRRTYQGVFLEPGFISRRLDHDRGGCDGCSSTGSSMATETTFGPQMLIGWHWTWDSGLNVALAGGVGRNWSTADGDDDGSEKIFGNGYLRFGYAF